MDTPRRVKFPLQVGGARPGNTLATKHGLCMKSGRLPPGCEDILESTTLLEQQLEDEILRRHGEVDIYHSALIRDCVIHERRLQLLQRWLSLEGPALSVGDRAQLVRDMGAAAKDLTKGLQELGLDKKFRENLWEGLHEPQDDGDQPEGVPREPAD